MHAYMHVRAVGPLPGYGTPSSLITFTLPKQHSDILLGCLAITGRELVMRCAFDGLIIGAISGLAFQVFEDVAYTYGELDLASSRIANLLLARLGPGSEPVAMLMPHGAEMFAVLLGILEAGKFYVPLDVSYPDARNRAIWPTVLPHGLARAKMAGCSTMNMTGSISTIACSALT